MTDPAVAEAPRTHSVLAVTGMRCAACAGTIEKAVGAVPGVVDATVNFATEQLAVRWAVGAAQDLEHVARRVREAGYQAQAPVTGGPSDAVADSASREWVRVAVAVGLAALVLILDWSGAAATAGGAWAALVATAAVIGAVAGPFYRGAWDALRRRTSSMDTLIALGTGVAFGYGLATLIAPAAVPGMPGHFFHAAALLLAFVSVGKLLEVRARRRATRALRALLDLTPARASVERDGAILEIDVRDVVVEDVVRVAAGRSVPVDGVVTDGQGAVDESMLTGESVPVERGPGDPVLGGTVVRSGGLQLRATGVGDDTAVARITRMVEEAQAGRAPIQRFADAGSAWFVPPVVLLAIGAGGAWALAGAGAATAISRAVAVLVIACPCALGLATPVSVLVGSAVGLRRGILVKHAAALEAAGRIGTVAFDKTGTLTRGEPQLIETVPHGDTPLADVWRLVRPVAASSTHPLAQSIAAAAGPDSGVAAAVRELPGRGVTGEVNGVEVALGNARLMAREAPNAAWLIDTAEALAQRGLTPVLAARDGAPLAVFGLQDRPRNEAAAVVAALHSMGLRTALISGDRRPVAEAVARELGITEVHAEVAPDAKVDAVQTLRAAGAPVAMVGDGINDAPALATADLGIAVGAGSDVAKESGDLVLVRDDLTDVLRAIRLGRATLGNIRQNLFWALAYNVAMVPAAALGWIHPGLAGLAMACSSLSVVANALRLRRARIG